MMKTASLYLRISRISEESTSIERQERDLRALADRLGLQVVAVHRDEGLSGGKRDRPGFLAWLDDARQGRADHLLVWSFDRVTREGASVAAEVFDAVEGKDRDGREVFPKVRLVSHDDRLDSDSPAFDLLASVMAALARGERQRMISRARSSRSAARRSGRWHGGPAPYGFRAVESPDGPGKVLDLEPEEAEFLRWAASEVLSGVPLGRVSRRLGERGSRPRRAASWSRITLRQALTGDHVLGRITHRGEVVRDEEGRPFAPYPAVLDLETVTELRRVLEPKVRKAVGRRPSRLLSGLLQCHGCGSALMVARRSDGSTTYRCQRSSDGGACPAQVVTSAPAVEGFVEGFYLRSFGSLPIVERRVEVEGGGDLAEVEERISALSSALAREAKPETFEALRVAQEERGRITAAPRRTVERLVYTDRTTRDEWLDRDVHGRRALLEEAFEALILLPGRRGPRGFDPARLQIVARQTDPIVD